jgi:hypothetical protein
MPYKSTHRHPRSQDLTGRPFTDWTVIRYAGGRDHHTYWTCQCVCGTIQDVRTDELLNTQSRSCGCTGGQRGGQARTKHGKYGTPEYRIWAQMLQRCENTHDAGYHRYGGRGITVCQEWHAFPAFYADMGDRPSARHTLERVDNMQGYSKSNCLWITRAMQSRNKRTNRMITYNGITQCVTDWSITTGLSYYILASRLKKGMPPSQALTMPSRNKAVRHTSSARPLVCHPERPHCAKGLCSPCYQLSRRQKRRQQGLAPTHEQMELQIIG